MTRPSPAATARTLLFVPGNREDRFAKALAAGADLVVFDLEDAVPADEKARARELVVRAVQAASAPVAVRINGVDTKWHTDDVAALRDTPAHLMLPKAERASDIAGLGIDDASARSVIALIETPLGIAQAVELASAPGVARLAFGSLDFAAALGISPDDRTALLFARSQLVIGSGASQLNGPIDGVTQNVRESEAVVDDMDYAQSLGFTGKLCIHPAQLEPTTQSLQPSDEEVAWAQRIMAAVDAPDFAQGGVVVVDGRMVDAPVVKRAEAVLAYSSPSSGVKFKSFI